MVVTLKQVAQKAGVSASAVSAALNGADNSKSGTRVSEATIEKVKNAARQLGYKVNPMASALRGGRTKTIGVLWGLGRPGAEGMMSALSNNIYQHGYCAQVISSLSDPDLISDALDDMLRRRVDGVVFQASRTLLENPKINHRLDQFSAAVVVTTEPLDVPYSQVARDTPTAIKKVVDFLVATGRKRPCFFEFSGHSNEQKERSFLERLNDHNLPVENAVVHAPRLSGLHYPFGLVEHFKKALQEQFPSDFSYDAVFGSNDQVAAAALLHLRDLGMKVPDDVAIVGFDNVDLTCATDPPLASIGWNHLATAEAATKLLFNKLENPDQKLKTKILPMQFIWRQSAGGSAPAGAIKPSSTSGRAGVSPAIPAQQETLVGRISETHPTNQKMEQKEDSFIHPTNATTQTSGADARAESTITNGGHHL